MASVNRERAMIDIKNFLSDYSDDIRELGISDRKIGHFTHLLYHFFEYMIQED